MDEEKPRRLSFRDRFKGSFERLRKGEGFRLDKPADKTMKAEQMHRQYTPQPFHTRYLSAESILLNRQIPLGLPLRTNNFVEKGLFVQRKFPTLRPLLLHPQAKPGSKGFSEIRTNNQGFLAGHVSNRRENPAFPYGQIPSKRRKEPHSGSLSARLQCL